MRPAPTTTFVTTLLALSFAACFLEQKSKSSDAGADGATAAPAGTVSPTGDAGVSGCATDPITKVTLCSAVAACPTLVINHDVFPNCGYRARGGAFDIQCWCDGYVCPLGSPTTCAEVEQLMSNQSEQLVCLQINDGRCTQPQKTAGTTGSSTACNDCMKQCGYTPACKDLCGC